MVFDYPAKSGQRRVQGIVDPQALEVVTKLRRRRAGGEELLAFQRGRTWRDVRSEDINSYLKDATGDDFSAKDFRTWSATVLAAVALAVSGEVAATKTGRERAVLRAVKEVAHYLGNTPAVCRGVLHRPARVRRLPAAGSSSTWCARPSPARTRSCTSARSRRRSSTSSTSASARR
jgi:DNA topoisomerase IB